MPETPSQKKKKEREARTKALHLENGTVVKDRWTVVRKLGQGGFGAVYEVDDNLSVDNYAMKVEANWISAQLLRMEIAVLQKCGHSDYVPDFMGAGNLPPDKNFVVMQLVGQNLSSLRRSLKDKKASVCTTLKIGLHALGGLKDIHAGGFLHRDIKPSNYAVGAKGTVHEKIVYVLDFGLARQYMKDTGVLRPARTKAGFRGTVRFASVTAHNKTELGRQDDIWSLMFMLVEFATGDLPWKRNLDKEEVGKIKRSTPIQTLCDNCPACFTKIMVHLNTLKYQNEPGYVWMLDEFRQDLTRLGLKETDKFDWEKGNNKQTHTSNTSKSACDTQVRPSTFAQEPDEQDQDPTN